MQLCITEQPGRLFAILIFGPCLVIKGSKFNDTTLIILGIIFILYELFWIINYEPRTIHILINNNDEI